MAASEKQLAVWAGALTRRIEAYFVNNPEEWLSLADMAINFDCTETQAAMAIAKIRADQRMTQESMRIIRLVPFKAEA